MASFAQAPKKDLIDHLHDHGVKVMPSIGAKRHAEKVMEWGVDAVLVQGGEGGGHTGAVPTSLLLPQVVDVVDGRVPVVAAGGYFDGRGLVAALAYGASGIAMGTRFLLTSDSAVPAEVKKAYLGTPVTGTLVTTKIDGAPHRVIRTELVEEMDSASPVTAVPKAIANAARFREVHGALVAADGQGGPGHEEAHGPVVGRGHHGRQHARCSPRRPSSTVSSTPASCPPARWSGVIDDLPSGGRGPRAHRRRGRGDPRPPRRPGADHRPDHRDGSRLTMSDPSAEQGSAAPTARTVLDGPDAVRAAVGTHLGYSDWLEITQERVNLFADATGDHQWIHVDPERAKDGPFGGPIAHGYLTMSLSNYFLPQIVETTGFSAGVNYGVDKVRFITPVPVGGRIRAGVELAEVSEVAGGLQTLMRITIELEGADKPACVIDALSRWLV